ncbi:hypothetical protein [Streptomyces vietnamensis]|uniref:hypothetical protein n=1 Tax=Streptomyces vietnamensis TaxID=362257 RepID=UPI0026B5B980
MSLFFCPPWKRVTACSRTRSLAALPMSVNPPPCAYLTVQGYRNGPTTIRRTVRHHPIKFRSASRITFRQYGEKWLASQTTDTTTRTTVGVHLRLHAFPYLGTRPIDSFRPEHIREWLAGLEKSLPVSSYRRVIFASVSAVLAAARGGR